MQQVHFVALEQHSCLLVVYHLSVALDGLVSESYEVSIVIEQDRRGGLLVVLVVARIKHFDARLLSWLHLAGSDSEPSTMSELLTRKRPFQSRSQLRA